MKGPSWGCFAAVTALAALLACTSSCGNESPEAKRGKKTPGEGAQAAPDTGPQPGGHLRLPSNEPRYLNPVLETRFDRANLLIFEGLVGLDSRLEPVPRLAEKWDLSSDARNVTFTLRQNVKWHDGEPFTSRDVAFTFESIRDTTAPSIWKAYVSGVESLETPDDHTVVIKYKRPYAPALMAWTVGIIPRHVYGKDDLVASPGNQEPVGTGPYKLARWETGKRLVLHANSAWWYGRPYIDSIELVVNLSAESTLDALTRGQLDFALIDSIGDWSTRMQMPEFRETFEVSDLVEARFRTIAWNVQRPILADRRVRQGLTHALNRGRVIDDVLLGQARAISAPFFPNMFGADPSIAPYPFSLDRAVKLLDEAGHAAAHGQRFTLDMIAIESQRDDVTDTAMGIFRNDLKAIGVELKISYLPVRDFFDRITVRDFDAAYFGWLPDIPDPDPYALLHSSMIAAGTNFAGYVNAEVDGLLEEARATTARDERKALYHKLHRVLHDEAPYTVIYAPYGHYAWSRRVRGVNPHDIGAQPRFPGVARWWISTNMAALLPDPAAL
jgi:peptide/nickel transport system substrate-binding protein